MALWFIAIVSAFWLVLSWTGFWVGEQQQGIEGRELERVALMQADSLVKNRVEEKPAFGAAVWDAEKHRVRSHALDRGLLGAIPATQDENEPFFFQKIEWILPNGTETVFLIPKNGKCVSVERFVLVENQKGIVRGTVCHA